jgi:hypothetical protein
MIENMGENKEDFEDELSKMFLNGKIQQFSDEELALHIIHKFNIDRDTIDTMPAFEEHLKPLFSQIKNK